MSLTKPVIMVHDGAYYGRELVTALRKTHFPIIHLTRSRKLFDKTFKIAFKILRANGALYHVNVALQDAFITLILKKFLKKKPVIVNCHGTDLRTNLQTPKFSRLVKFNVRNADFVFFANLDNKERALSLNSTAKWLPIPINLETFYPSTPLNGSTLRLFYPNKINEAVRGSLTFLKVYSRFARNNAVQLDIISHGKDLNAAYRLCKKEGLSNRVRFISSMPHNFMRQAYLNYHATIGIFTSGIISTVGLESFAVKRPILNFVNPKLHHTLNYPSYQTPAEILEGLYILTDSKARRRSAEAGYNYVKQTHDVKKVAETVRQTYNRFLGGLI